MNTSLKEGYIYDYISGIEVKATPEELNAVQVFSKILVVSINTLKKIFKQDRNSELKRDLLI